MKDRKAYMKMYYEEHREELKAYSKNRREEYPEYNKNWREEHPEERKEYYTRYNKEHPEKMKRYREEHPEKVICQNAINSLIRSGKLIRQPCSLCGKPKAHAHHPDYNKPLDVIWLCQSHHKQLHANAKNNTK